MAKDRDAKPLSKATAAVLLGAYKKKGMSQADIVAKTGMSTTTVQRIFSGKADIDTDQLGLLCYAIGVNPVNVIEEAIGDLGGLDALVSEAPTHNVTELHPRDMNVEQLENLKHAAAPIDDEATTPDTD